MEPKARDPGAIFWVRPETRHVSLKRWDTKSGVRFPRPGTFIDDDDDNDDDNDDDDDDDDGDEFFLWYGWPTKDLALFPSRTIVRDPYHREFVTQHEQDLYLRRTVVQA